MTTKTTAVWRLRTGATVIGAALAVATVLGPGMVATRLGAGETVAFAATSAVDTMTSRAVLAEVPAAGVSKPV
jgi:hypothetical protein